MKLAIDIVQSLFLPKLEKDTHFDVNQTTSAFWKDLTAALLDFETNAKPAQDVINHLQLHDTERINAKLPSIYAAFIKELAENQVLGISSEAVDYLIASKNSTFKKEVQFYTDLEHAIKKVERKRMKAALPNSLDKLAFELNDELLNSAITKKSRDELKKKMAGWDQQLVETEETTPSALANKNESKVIYFGWVKYAAAACLVLGLGIWFFQHQQAGFTPENNVVTTPPKDTTKGAQIPEFPIEALADITTVTKKAAVVESGLGYAPTKQTIKIVEYNQKARMTSIVAAIEKHRQLLEKQFGDHNTLKLVESKIHALQNELALLKERENQYVFDGKSLTLYVTTTPKENTILLYENTYYLNRGADFFKLTIAVPPQPYQKERNIEIREALDKMIFTNGN
ncbi:MAG: hypothetical protein CFE24_13195 [Flavobacterium sp. BFFFF2]|nr:MAG: hypothetical protein CFE24_13195 [Flavobacterium sp. BFFFF2]